MVDTLDKNLNKVFKCSRSLRRRRKITYEQSENIKTDIEKHKKEPKRDSGAEKYNYWDEKLIQGVQNRGEEAEDTISEPEDRITESIESEEQKKKKDWRRVKRI